MSRRLREAVPEDGTHYSKLIDASGAYAGLNFSEDRGPDMFALYDRLLPGRPRLFYGVPHVCLGGIIASSVVAPAWAREVFWTTDFYTAQKSKGEMYFAELLRTFAQHLRVNCENPFLYGLEHAPYSFEKLGKFLAGEGLTFAFHGWSDAFTLETGEGITQTRMPKLADLSLDRPLARLWTERDLTSVGATLIETPGASALIADLDAVKRFRVRGQARRTLTLGAIAARSPEAQETLLAAAVAHARAGGFDMIYYRDVPFVHTRLAPAKIPRRLFTIHVTGRADPAGIAQWMEGFRTDSFAI